MLSVVDMLTDAMYAAPATELAVLHSIAPSASTFVYCLNYSVTALGHGRPGLGDTNDRGVVHGDDLGLVFGAAINDGIEPFISSGYTRLDRAVTEIIMTYWANFIWTGSVNSVISATTPCLKNRANYFFCSVSVKYEPISMKIGRHLLE